MAFADKRNMIKVAVITALISLITFGYVFVNFTPSHDGMMTVTIDQAWQLSIGRFLMLYYVKIRGAVDSPWFIGVLSTIYLSVSIYFTMKVLAIDFDWWKVSIVSAIMVLSISFIVTAAVYIYLLDIFVFALLLAVTSVYVFTSKQNLYGFIIAAVLLALSMGGYQIYLQVAIGMYMIMAIRDLADNMDVKSFFKKYVMVALNLLVAGGLYYVLLRIALHLNKVSMYKDSYNSVANAFNSSPIKILKLIPGCYYKVFSVLFLDNIYSSSITIGTGLLICIIGIFFYGHWIFFRTKAISNRILVAILLLLFPLGINCVYVISGGMVHQLMVYSYQLVYLLCLYPILVLPIEGNKVQSCMKQISIVIIAVYSFFVIRFANDLFYYQNMVGKGTCANITNIVYDMDRIREFEPQNMRIVLLGNIPDALSQNYKSHQMFEHTSGVGSYGTTITYNDVFGWYLKNLLGRDYEYTYDSSVIDEIKLTSEYKDMSVYPKQGYLKVIGEYLVIRFE